MRTSNQVYECFNAYNAANKIADGGFNLVGEQTAQIRATSKDASIYEKGS